MIHDVMTDMIAMCMITLLGLVGLFDVLSFGGG